MLQKHADVVITLESINVAYRYVRQTHVSVIVLGSVYTSPSWPWSLNLHMCYITLKTENELLFLIMCQGIIMFLIFVLK